MDIVTLKTSKRRRSSLSRRHTTEVTIDQLPSRTSLAPDYVEASLSQDSNPFDDHNLSEYPRGSLGSSWSSLYTGAASDFETSSEISDARYLEGSQSDVFQELQAQQYDLLAPAKHQYQLSYELALDNMLTPFAASNSLPGGSKPLSHVAHVIQEMVTTEKTYVSDLTDVIEGYNIPLKARVGILPLKTADLAKLFGNISEIRNFNKSLLESLQECGHSPKRVGQCFLDNGEGFKIYTQYCNNYPSSVKVFTSLLKESEVSRFLKICQQRLNHMLPLGAYLLKPVQRVLKYSLLLEDMANHLKTSDDGYNVVHSALQKMTTVAEHINAMKKKYDAAVHVQEIQSLIRGWEGIDLTKYGDVVLEENFRFVSGKSSGPAFRSRTERYAFLFQKLLLITKKEEDGYQYKTHLEMKDIQLTERVERDPNCFQVRQVSTGRFYTLQARTLQGKDKWVKTIKLLLMESIPHLPDKARLLILAGFPTDLSEVTRRSPHLRQRHISAEVKKSQQTEKANVSPKMRKSATRTKSSASDKAKTKNRHQRASTSPNIIRATISARQSFLQAGLTGFLASTVHPHQQREGSPIEEEDDYIVTQPRSSSGSPLSTHEGRQRDSGFSESSTGVPDEDPHKHTCSSESPLVDTQSSPSESARLRRNKPSYDEEDTRLRKQKKRNGTEQSPTDQDITLSNDEMQPPHTQNQSDSERSVMNGITPEGMQPVLRVPHEKFHGLPLIAVNGAVAQPELEATAPPPPEQFLQLEPNTCSANVHIYLPEVEEVESNLERAEDSIGIIEPPLMFSESESELEMESNSVSEVVPEGDITEDEESLFNELMDSSSGIVVQIPSVGQSKSSTLSRGDAEVLKSLLKQASSQESDEDFALNESETLLPPREFSSPDPQDETPKASPFLMRRWTVQGKTSPVEPENEDTSTTPKASPYIRRHTTPSTRGHSSASSAEDIPIIIEPPSLFRNISRSSSVRSMNMATEVPILPAPLQFSEKEAANTQAQSLEAEGKVALSVTSSLTRRHSYSSEHNRKILVARGGTKSTGTSPSASPGVGSKKQDKEGSTLDSPISSTLSVLQRHDSFDQSLPQQRHSISMVGLVSTTRSDLSLEDMPSVCPQLSPPEAQANPVEISVKLQPCPVEHVTNRDLQSRLAPPRNSPTAKAKFSTAEEKGEQSLSREKKDHDSPRSLFRFYRHKKAKPSLASSESLLNPSKEAESESPPAAVAPYEGNPEERLSFDEILSSFDQYASATGKTTKTKPRIRPPSPVLSSKTKKEKKRRRRSNTVANVDADTIKLVRASLAAQNEVRPSPRPRSGTVQHLTKQYSRLIQEQQKSKVVIKRHATIAEKPLENPSTEHEPEWLHQLKQRKRTKSQSSQEELTPPIEEACFPQAEQAQLKESPDLVKSKIEIKTKSLTLPKHSTHEPASGVLTPARATLPTRSPRLPRLLQRTKNEDVFSNFDAVSEPGDVQVDFERKGRFRGWVKSLVERFSGTSKEK